MFEQCGWARKNSPIILPNKDKIDTTECEILVESVTVTLLAIYSTIDNIDVINLRVELVINIKTKSCPNFTSIC